MGELEHGPYHDRDRDSIEGFFPPSVEGRVLENESRACRLGEDSEIDVQDPTWARSR